MKRFLAMTAVLFLLLRPLCDAWGATHSHAAPGASSTAATAVADGHSADQNSDEFCCSKVQDSNLIPPAGIALAGPSSDGWSLAAASGIRMGRAHLLQARVRHPPDAPPLQLSYYARSARILR